MFHITFRSWCLQDSQVLWSAVKEQFRDGKTRESNLRAIADLRCPYQCPLVVGAGCVRIAEALTAGGQELGPNFGAEVIRITPRSIIAWGLDTAPSAGANARDVPETNVA